MLTYGLSCTSIEQESSLLQCSPSLAGHHPYITYERLQFSYATDVLNVHILSISLLLLPTRTLSRCQRQCVILLFLTIILQSVLNPVCILLLPQLQYLFTYYVTHLAESISTSEKSIQCTVVSNSFGTSLHNMDKMFGIYTRKT